MTSKRSLTSRCPFEIILRHRNNNITSISRISMNYYVLSELLPIIRHKNMAKGEGNKGKRKSSRRSLKFDEKQSEQNSELSEPEESHGDSMLNKQTAKPDRSKTSKRKRGGLKQTDNESVKKGKRDNDDVGSSKKVVATIEEEGQLIEYTVEGQMTDFNSENETLDTEDEGSHKSDESDKEDDLQQDRREEWSQPNRGEASSSRQNFNSSNIVGPYLGPGRQGCVRTSQFDEESDVIVFKTSEVQKQNMQTQPMQREMSDNEMKRFASYMKQQGLMLVDSSQMHNRNLNLGQKSCGKEITANALVDNVDNHSEITIYRNAVEQMTESSKRDSSSSEEPLNTSDEIDKMPLDNLALQTMNENDNFQFFADQTRTSIIPPPRGYATSQREEVRPHCSYQQQHGNVRDNTNGTRGQQQPARLTEVMLN